jgi:hypothetical protein
MKDEDWPGQQPTVKPREANPNCALAKLDPEPHEGLIISQVSDQ